MVWGAISSDGVLQLAFVTCRMDSSDYQKVLNDHLLPFLRGRCQQAYTFMQDNAAIHVSRSTMGWLEAHNIKTLDWPACSPDLNPIENVWGIIVRNIYANNTQYNSIADLKTAVEDAWNTLDLGTIKKLYDSMSDRLFQVILKKGSPASY